MAVLACVAETGFEAALLSLAFSCAFFGAFRVGELVAASRRSRDTGLLFLDMVFREEAVLCRLPVDVRGLRWPGFVELVLGKEQDWGRPDWIVVHLGGNDIGHGKGIDLILRIKRDFLKILEAWQGVRLVWSDIIPRRAWLGSRGLRALDRVRKRVNFAVAQFVVGHWGVAIRHPQLVHENQRYFFRDRVHLSDSGTRVLLDGIFSAIG